MSYLLSRNKMKQGIGICLNNALHLLKSAKALLSAESSVSTAIFTLALEEYGKSRLLENELRRNGKELVEISNKIFEGRIAHKIKLSEAARHLPAEVFELRTGAFASENFGPDFVANVIADLDARFRSLYVNWMKGPNDWSAPPRLILNCSNAT
jgi:AbiV family abortive infection protein